MYLGLWWKAFKCACGVEDIDDECGEKMGNGLVTLRTTMRAYLKANKEKQNSKGCHTSNKRSYVFLNM